MPKYTVIIRPCSDLERVHVEGTADGYGVSGDVRGHVTLDTEGRRFHLCMHSSPSRFDEGPEDATDENDVGLELDLPDDAAALEWLDWFDGLCLDPWRVDFIFEDDREVYVR